MRGLRKEHREPLLNKRGLYMQQVFQKDLQEETKLQRKIPAHINKIKIPS